MTQKTDNKCLLTIAIPTYNRADYLSENLDAILSQIDNYRNDIEILINDNCSPDNTTEVVRSLSEKYSFDITYHRMDSNIGIKANFDDVTSKASGKYLFLMGDDDILSPHFFDTIFPYLRSNKNYGIIHFNRLSGDASCDMNKLHDWKYDGLAQSLSHSDFWKRVMSAPNFLSSTITRRDCYERGEAFERKDYYGYEFFSRQLFGTMNEECLYYYMPLVLMRNPSRTWAREASLYFLVGMNSIFRDLEQYIPGIHDIWVHRMMKTHFYDFYTILAGVTCDAAYYRTHETELMAAMPNKKSKFIIKILLHAKPAKLVGAIYRRLLRLYRLFFCHYTYVRKTDF